MAYRLGIASVGGSGKIQRELAGRVLGFSTFPRVGDRIAVQIDSLQGEVNVVLPVQEVLLAALPNKQQFDGWLGLGEPESLRRLDMTPL